jgi:hypothetical protein
MKITSRRTTRPLSDPKASQFESKRQQVLGEIEPGEIGELPQDGKVTPQNKPQYKYLDTKRKLEEDEKAASQILQDLANKNLKQLTSSDISPGNFVYFQYKAKGADHDANFVYDKTPVSFFLSSHHQQNMILGINLHWLVAPMRKTIMNAIIKLGRSSIQAGRIPVISYAELRPVLKNIGAIYAVRLYIKNRISSRGISIPAEYFLKVAEHLPPEQITNGYSAEQIHRQALMTAKKTKPKKGSRYRRVL